MTDASKESSEGALYLIRALPKSWQNYVIVAISLSFGIYALGALSSYSEGNLGSFLASPEWSFEPFYLLTHMVVLKLLYDVLNKKLGALNTVFDLGKSQLAKDISTIFNSGGALLLAIPFIVYDTGLSLGGARNLVAPEILLVTSWDIEWLFFGCILWFMIGFLLFMPKLSRYTVKGSAVEIVVGERLAGIKSISSSIAVPIIIFEFVATYYFFAAGFWASDVAAFFAVLVLIALIFAVPRVVVGSILGGQKNQIVNELTANYVAYVQKVLNGQEEFDANKALQHQEMRNLLEKRLGERRDVVKGVLPIMLPLLNLALAYIVQTELGHVII